MLEEILSLDILLTRKALESACRRLVRELKFTPSIKECRT
jgi:hypothetical protein